MSYQCTTFIMAKKNETTSNTGKTVEKLDLSYLAVGMQIVTFQFLKNLTCNYHIISDCTVIYIRGVKAYIHKHPYMNVYSSFLILSSN